ncbi:hypothetical protein M422DRAFT_186136, partial [Sphaerobolus stellatus SS14]
HKLEWQYGKKHNGMYIDGHEREDVVTYHVEGGQFHIILVTHDESTFYANDRRKTTWGHSSDKAVPQPKRYNTVVSLSSHRD